MIKEIKNKFLKIDNKDKFYAILFTFFPISLILGNLIINLFFLLFSISFFLNLKENKYFIKNKIIFLLLFFFISLLTNLIFSLYPINSFPRIIKIFFIILFIIESLRIFQKYDDDSIGNFFLGWSVILIIVIFDCFFEIIFGFNTLGYSTPLVGRVASFFGDELVVGAFIYGFSLFFISFLIMQNTNNYIIAISILAVIIVSFLIGERSNFIKLFISIIFFSVFAVKTKFLNKILTFLILICFVFGILKFNEDYKHRYFKQFKNLYSFNGLTNFYKESQYGAHQNAAIKIFKEFPIFGVGVKNFRYESNKEKYKNSDLKATNSKQTTHPHQIHLELLSETGIFGYLSFIIFILFSLAIGIKNFSKYRNVYQLASIVFIFTSIVPILPSGSFLSTFNSAIFWINFSVMVGYCKLLKSKF